MVDSLTPIIYVQVLHYLVELDDLEDPGRLYGAELMEVPITIIDTSPNGG